MRATGWSNGQPRRSGAGFGVRISRDDRDRHFHRAWDHVLIDLGSEEIDVKLSKSFWGSCTELRSAALGRWLMAQGLAPWGRNEPPKLHVNPVGENRFRLRLHPD